MDEAAPKSTSESDAMLVANKRSHLISKSYSAAKDEGISSKFSQHKDIITPKVRVVYVYEPEIIKTDPENFPSLVQRLTGKSSRKSREKQRQMKQKSPSSELIAAETGIENLENTFYNNDQTPIMENETTKFSTEDWSCFSEGFSAMDMILQNLRNQ
jgi:hypothetical protein